MIPTSGSLSVRNNNGIDNRSYRQQCYQSNKSWSCKRKQRNGEDYIIRMTTSLVREMLLLIQVPTTSNVGIYNDNPKQL